MDYQDGCIMSPFGDVFWHSNIPNAKITINSKCNMKIDVVATEDNHSGEEILVNYQNNGAKVLTRDELMEQINQNTK